MRNTKEAFNWIVDILEKENIPFVISGGLAARYYGSKRNLADIDIEVSKSHIPLIASKVNNYIIFGPTRYIDSNWDLELLTIKYKGQEIDIADKDSKLFNKHSNKWESSSSNNGKYTQGVILGRKVQIENIEELMSYKLKLMRKCDIKDLNQLVRIYKLRNVS